MLSTFTDEVHGVLLKPSETGGAYIVTINEVVMFDRKEEGRFSKFNAKQMERVCHLYGGIVEQEVQQQVEQGRQRTYSREERSALHYVMIEGAMHPTREKGEPWREVKIGSGDTIGRSFALMQRL